MSDAATAIFIDHFIAWPHKIFSGVDFKLLRPAHIGQQAGDIQGVGGKRRNLGIGEPGNIVGTHLVNAHATAWNGDRRAVLYPQYDAFIVLRRGQARVKVGGPGVGVVRA